jgi:hypothetical protein
LHLAAKCIEIEIAKELVNNGANREIKNNFGKLWGEMVDKRWAQGKMFDDALYGMFRCYFTFLSSDVVDTVKSYKEANPEKEEVLLIKREPSKRSAIQSKKAMEAGLPPPEATLTKAQSKRVPTQTSMSFSIPFV